MSRERRQSRPSRPGAPYRHRRRTHAGPRLRTTTASVPRLRLAGRPAPPAIAVPAAYEWLSAEDRMFLSFEKPNAHMHVGATLLFEAGPLATAGAGVDVARIRRHIGAQLSAVPRYRQRLHPTPIDGLPVWIDDDRFELRAHVHHVRLDRSDDVSLLTRLSSRILSRPLSRSRALWEMWVVDGFAPGRFAIISKMHHCMVDGIAGADLLALVLSPTAKAVALTPAAWQPRPAPGPTMLMRDRAARLLGAVREAVRVAGAVARDPARAWEWSASAAALWRAVGLGLWPAPDSPFNRPIGPHRRFEWFSFDLADVKRVKNTLGGTVNDVVLATVAGGLRRLLARRAPELLPADLRALVPVSTRTAADAAAVGNHVGAWIMPLPVGEADALRCFARVRLTTAALKQATDQQDTGTLTGAGCALVSAGVRLFERLRPFNVVITNVPGPPLPLYLLGARLQHVFPLVPLFPNQGLGIAVFSYADRLCWGLNADCHIVPDLDALASALAASFAELQDAAAVMQAREA